MTFLLYVLSIVTICVCLFVRFEPDVRSWLCNAFPWLVESWTDSPNFVFWAAHSCFAALVVITAELYWPGHTGTVMVLGANVAALKEFVFDWTFERNPVQTDAMDWSDWCGYCLVGYAVAAVILLGRYFI